MDERGRIIAAGAGTVGLFAVVQVGALALVQPFVAAGFQPVSNPSNPANTLLYLVGIFAATGLMLAAIRFGVEGVIKVLVLGTAGLLHWLVLGILIERFLPVLPGAQVAAVVAVGVVAVLYAYPEWYVIDAAALVMGAGAAGMFGLSLGILPVLILLVVLATYDAVSVYGTEHMLELADNAMNLRIPVLFVVPTTLSYSFLDDDRPAVGSGDDESVPPDPTDPGDENGDPDPEGVHGGDGERGPADEGGGDPAIPPVREALFVGLGDAVMPTILAVSAGVFLEVPRFDLPVLLNLPALCSLVGTTGGLVVLQYMVFRGRPHAGLPLLNGGAIAGYLVGATLSGVALVEAVGLAPFV